MRISKSRTTLILASVMAVLLLSVALPVGRDTATAQTPEDEQTWLEHARYSKGTQPDKLDSFLAALTHQYGTGHLTAHAAAESAPFSRGQSVALTLHIEEGYAQTVADYLLSSGGGPPNKGDEFSNSVVPHIFGALGESCNGLSLDSGETLSAEMRWEDSWGGANSDLHLYLVDASSNAVLLGSSRNQDGEPFDDPWEWFQWTSVSGGDYCLGIDYAGGPDPDCIQLRTRRHSLQHSTPHGSIINPAESANTGMVSVGAAPWHSTSTIQHFSSRGPTPDGRVKPEIVGVDDTYSRARGRQWLGTSVATSHVAGLAALTGERFPEKSAQQVAEYLKEHAQARGSVPNNTWGYGFAYLPASYANPYTEAVGDRTTISGTWTDLCVSGSPAEDGGDRYARNYTLGLAAAASVSLELTSDEDTYLFLLGNGVSHENDDIERGSNNNSRIEADLEAGDYIIVATTYESETIGDFTLVVNLNATTVAPTPVPPPPIPGAPSPTPTPGPAPSGGYTEVSRCYDHACALHSDGSVTCWGANDQGQATRPSGTFVSVSSDHKGSCAVRSDGEVLCWGSFVVNP